MPVLKLMPAKGEIMTVNMLLLKYSFVTDAFPPPSFY